MYLAHMHPDQIRRAVADNLPVLMAAGVIEYHGPHLPVGTDFLVPDRIVDCVQARCRCIAAPPIPYGPTMTWAGPAEDGNIDFDPTVSYLYAKEIFRQLIKVGFRRIYVMQYHQGDGAQALRLRLAAREAMDELTANWQPGWGRRPSDTWPLKDPFGLVRVMSIDAGERYPYDDEFSIGHASRGETQLVMGVDRSLADLSKLSDIDFPTPDWLRDSHLATPEDGERWIEFCVAAWVRALNKN